MSEASLPSQAVGPGAAGFDQSRSRAWSWLRQEGRSLFLGLLLLHLVPVWALPFFPTQDGPVHVETANIVRRYHEPERALFRTFYSLNREPEPNLLSHWVMAGLLSVFPPLVTEKLLVSLYVLLLPLSVRYALRSIDPRGTFLAVLAFPFVFSWFLHMGFYNFCLSVVLFFFAVGYWIRHQAGFSPRSVAGLAVLLILLYFAHIIGLVMALMLIGILCLWLPLVTLSTRRRGAREERAPVAPALLRAAWTALAALPVVLLTARFLERSHRMRREPPLPLDDLWRSFRDLQVLVSFQESEIVLARAVSWGFAAAGLGILLAMARKRSIRAWDGLLAGACAYACAYFALPSGLFGGAYLSERLALFPFLALMLWFGSHPPSSRPARGAIQGAAACIALCWLVLHLGRYAELAENFREYRSVEDQIEPDTTLLPLRYGGVARAPRVDVFLKTAGYIAASRNVVQLVNHAGHKRHFPIVFRPGLDPYDELGNAETRPPCVDILSYSARTGITVDYVLLWHLRPVELREACVRSVLDQLAAAYELVYTSTPRGLARLYRRRDWGARGAIEILPGRGPGPPPALDRGQASTRESPQR